MCRKDRGDEAIGERDILVTGFWALIEHWWRRSVQKRGNGLAFSEANTGDHIFQ